MLRWRLPIAISIIAVLVLLCWLDHQATLAGSWLMPVGVLLAVLATGETVGMSAAAGARPRNWLVYVGNILIVLANLMPVLFPNCFTKNTAEDGCLVILQSCGAMIWPFMTLTVCILIAIIEEIRLFEKPGEAVARLAATIFGLIYVGLLFSFIVQLRIVWGIGAMLSLVIVVKMGDTGAYFTGRLLGRHKLIPRLSPGKTVEGAVGALVFSCLGAWLGCRLIAPALDGGHAESAPWWGWILYGLTLGVVGMLGDLAESMIKRDAGRKDSSTWLPGLGGVLDILDSLLLSAPVAWIFWIWGLV